VWLSPFLIALWSKEGKLSVLLVFFLSFYFILFFVILPKILINDRHQLFLFYLIAMCVYWG
jgi:hypothetical protein